jgi:hypothetical protein
MSAPAKDCLAPTRKSRPSVIEMSADLSKYREEELEAMVYDVREWMGRVLQDEGEMDLSPSREGFFESIADGVRLCELVRKIQPENRIKPKKLAKAGSFLARDNIAQFLAFLASIKVNVTFETSDLVERKNERQVVLACLALGRAAWELAQIEPPNLVAMELRAEEENDDDQGGEEEEAQEEEEEEEEQEEEIKTAVPPLSAPKKKRKRMFKSKVDKKNALDVAVARIVNSEETPDDIPVWRGTRKGQYVVGSGRKKIAAVLINGVVLVRVGGGWESLLRFLICYRYSLNKGVPGKKNVSEFHSTGQVSGRKTKKILTRTLN